MARLTKAVVDAVTRPGKLCDGDGLYLIIQPGGTKSWVCRVQKHGIRREIGLGPLSKISLALARSRARDVRTQMEIGLDPLFERRKAQGIPTFKEATNKVLAQQSKSWRNAKHEKQWRTTLEAYAFPYIGNVKVVPSSTIVFRSFQRALGHAACPSSTGSN